MKYAKVHSLLKQCFAWSSLDTLLGYFKLIFKLTSPYHLGQRKNKRRKLERKENNGFIPKKLYKNENENMNEKKNPGIPFGFAF